VRDFLETRDLAPVFLVQEAAAQHSGHVRSVAGGERGHVV
jgi:hypothetical protein